MDALERTLEQKVTGPGCWPPGRQGWLNPQRNGGWASTAAPWTKPSQQQLSQDKAMLRDIAALSLWKSQLNASPETGLCAFPGIAATWVFVALFHSLSTFMYLSNIC